MQLSVALAPASSVSVLHEKRIYSRVCGHGQAAHRRKQRSSVNGSNHTRCAAPESFSEPFILQHKVLRPLCSTIATVVLVRWSARRTWPAMHASRYRCTSSLITRRWWAIPNVKTCDVHNSTLYCGLADHVPCLCTGLGRLLYLQAVSGTGSRFRTLDSITPRDWPGSSAFAQGRKVGGELLVCSK